MANSVVSTNSPTLGIPKKRSLVRAVVGGSVGNALEWFDYGLYGYFAPIISAQFFPSKDVLTSLMLTFIVFGVGFVMRPLGGIIFGHYADKVGRRNALAVTIFLMGISTCLMGLIPSFAQIGVAAPIILCVLRLTQGLATGGEWGNCMSFLAEYSGPNNRGFLTSWASSSIYVGMLAGSLLGLFLSSSLSAEALNSWGWRIPFIAGILIAGFGVYVRRTMDETPKFTEAVDANAICETPLSEVMKNYKREVAITVGLVIGWTISVWAIMGFMQTYIVKILKYPMETGFILNSVLLVCYILVSPFAGILSDKIGRKPVMIIGSLGFIFLTLPLYKLLGATQSMGVMVFAVGVMGVIEGVFAAGAVVFIPEIFPTKVRCSAIGIGYNSTVAIFGGTAPFVVTWLTKTTGDPLALTYYVIPAMCLTLLVLLFVAKETYKKPLG